MKEFRKVCTRGSTDNFQLVQPWFVTYRKKLEKVHFPDEECLHKKINNKYNYIWIIMCCRGYPRRCTVHAVKAIRQYGDLTVLNWSRWLKYYSFFLVKPVGLFWLFYFVLFLVLAELKTWFWFSLQSSNFCNLVRISNWGVLLPFFRSVRDGT